MECISTTELRSTWHYGFYPHFNCSIQVQMKKQWSGLRKQPENTKHAAECGLGHSGAYHILKCNSIDSNESNQADINWQICLS